jgi:2-polyprenyl-6-methoxyphenol hydroxylase-like FAD-dependent oxidoreductase
MRLLVVGAGPAGLALALALRRQGLDFRHIDRAAGPATQSRALGIQARTLETLAPFGLAGPIQAAALRPSGVVFHLGAVAHPITFSHAVHPGFPSMTILPQSTTERLLAEAGAAAGTAPVERGVALESVDAASGETMLRHADGRMEAARYDHVLGCDGAHSSTRKSAGIGFEGAAYEEQCVLADGPIEGLAPGRLHIFPGRGAGCFYFPLPDGQWRAVSMAPAGPIPPAEGELDTLRQPGLRFGPPVWWSAFRISHRIAPRFREGRVLLAGDAAHIHSPAGGQGMNLGIQDACALAQALARPETARMAALEAWATERRRIAALVVRRTDLLTRMVLGQNAGLRALRGIALRLAPHLPPARRRLERALAGLDYPAIAG